MKYYLAGSKSRIVFKICRNHWYTTCFHVTQKNGTKREEILKFAERLLTLAEEAYIGQPDGLLAIERQLVVFFIDGLSHDYLKMKVMRENPVTLQAAVTAAMSKQNLRKRFNLRTGMCHESNEPVPMEIDHETCALNATSHVISLKIVGHNLEITEMYLWSKGKINTNLLELQ